MVAVGCGKSEQEKTADQLNKWSDGVKASRAHMGTPVTLSEYQQVQDGMTYEQVVAIIGDNGHMLSEMVLPGLDIDSRQYIWENADFSEAQISFDHGKVAGRSQHNLK